MTHKWKASTLGHGETQCEYCHATNREIAVIGDINHCTKAPAQLMAPEGLPQPLSSSESIMLQNFLFALSEPVIIECEYRNWRGETSTRRIQPKMFWQGVTEWHPVPGLFLKAIDLDKGEERDFYVSDFNTKTLRKG